MKTSTCRSAFVAMSFSMSLLACGVPANKPVISPLNHNQDLRSELKKQALAQSPAQSPAQSLFQLQDYTFVMLKAPEFKIKKFLDKAFENSKLTLISGIVNPVDITKAINLKSDETFALITKVSPEGEFEVMPHPTQPQTLNIKPLKFGAKALLTLIAGKERAFIDLEALSAQATTSGDNFTLVLPDSFTMSKDEFREIRVDGIAENQLVFIGFKNSNPAAFSIENPAEKSNVLRVKALQNSASSNVSIVVGQQKHEIMFTTVAESEVISPIIQFSSPENGTAFAVSDDIKLVATIDNPVQGNCKVLFKDEAGNLLTTHPIEAETTSTQVTHLWKATDRSKDLSNLNIQAVYTCDEPQKEVTSGLVNIDIEVPIRLTLENPKGAGTVSPTQKLTFAVKVGSAYLTDDFTIELQRNGQRIQSLTKKADQTAYTFEGIINPESRV